MSNDAESAHKSMVVIVFNILDPHDRTIFYVAFQNFGLINNLASDLLLSWKRWKRQWMFLYGKNF